MPFIMKSLNNISRCQSVYRNSKVNIDGICAAHHAFVLTVCRNPGSTQEEISRELCLDKSTVARVLAHLEKHGYIKRIANEKDKRELLIYPTENLTEALPQIREVSKEWNLNICDGISEEEMTVFCTVLAKIEQNAKNVVEVLRGANK